MSTYSDDDDFEDSYGQESWDNDESIAASPRPTPPGGPSPRNAPQGRAPSPRNAQQQTYSEQQHKQQQQQPLRTTTTTGSPYGNKRSPGGIRSKRANSPNYTGNIDTKSGGGGSGGSGSGSNGRDSSAVPRTGAFFGSSNSNVSGANHDNITRGAANATSPGSSSRTTTTTRKSTPSVFNFEEEAFESADQTAARLAEERAARGPGAKQLTMQELRQQMMAALTRQGAIGSLRAQVRTHTHTHTHTARARPRC